VYAFHLEYTVPLNANRLLDQHLPEIFPSVLFLHSLHKVASFKIFGINEFAVRFTTLLTALLTAIVLWLFSFYYLKSAWLGNLVLLTIASTSGYMGYHVARHGDPDVLLTFEVLVYSLFYFVFIDKYPHGRWKYLMLFGITLTIATLTKSVAGLAPTAGLAIYTITQKNGRKALLDYRLYLGAFIILIMVLSYYLIRGMIDEGYLHAVYEQNFSVLHSYPGKPKHPEFSFYLSYLWNSAFKPFAYFLPLVFVPLLLGHNERLKRVIIFSLSVSIVFILGQSAALMKNEWYIAQAYPFLWLLFGAGVYGTLDYLLSFISKISIRNWSAVAIGVLIVAAFSVKTKRIFDRNMKSTYASNYIYEPEREGNFFRNLKADKPKINNFNIYSEYAQRSTDFYVQKFKHLDNAQVEAFQTNKLPQLSINDTIMACSNGIKNQMEEQYYYHVVYNDRYCNLYVVDSLKVASISTNNQN